VADGEEMRLGQSRSHEIHDLEFGQLGLALLLDGPLQGPRAVTSSPPAQRGGRRGGILGAEGDDMQPS
jgi:hypothetical protein